MRRIAGTILALLLLSACGTKGPLTLPHPEQKPPQDSKAAQRQ
jgi:predicted small lipoprotein YifL